MALEEILLSRNVVALFLALLSPIGLIGQQREPWTSIPIAPLHDFHPHQPIRIELKNGIVLFLQVDRESPFVSGSVLIPGGIRDEPPAKAGIIDMYWQTWRTSGSEEMSGDEMDDLLEAEAAHIETEGNLDSTTITWDSLKGDADQVYSLAIDLLFHPKFNRDKLVLAKQNEATSIMRRNDAEGAIAEREARKLVYGALSSYARQPELGTIDAVTLDDLSAWHDRTLKGRLIIGVSGNFDPGPMEAKLRTTFEELPLVEPEPARRESFDQPKPGVFLVNKEDVNQSIVEIVGLGTDRRNPDVPTIAVMNGIFSGGSDSRLVQKLRTELGLAYSLSGSYGFSYDHPETFRVMVRTKSASTVEVTKIALSQIRSLIEKPYTIAEVKRAKQDILNSLLFQYDTREKILAESMRLEFYGYQQNYLETFEHRIEEVTPGDVGAIAKKYIHPNNLAVLVVGNGPEIKPSLDELGMGLVQQIDITIPRSMPAASEEDAR